jgi:glycosyltransferase involved in cell wall biosynthesis
MKIRSKRLIFIINVPAFFLSHRLPIALAAKRDGWQVSLITGQSSSAKMEAESAQRLSVEGISHFQAPFKATGTNPITEAFGLLQVLRHVWRIKPDVIHTASPKGNLYGGIAARICGVPKLVIAVSGQGYLFTGNAGLLKRGIGLFYNALIKWVYRHPDCTVIVQNEDDFSALLKAGMLNQQQLVRIPGSGVDLSLFTDMPSESIENIVLLPARVLRDKGVQEFVDAARELKQSHPDWRFVLAGAADYANPSAFSIEQINAWVNEGIVEWWDYQSDMPAVYRQSAIVCLPSYREGMPKCLLEAAAAGKPVVTTDVIGCREAILPGVTGLLVPVKNPAALASALARLIENPDERHAFGQSARNLAQERFSITAVIERVLRIYQA